LYKSFTTFITKLFPILMKRICELTSSNTVLTEIKKWAENAKKASAEVEGEAKIEIEEIVGRCMSIVGDNWGKAGEGNEAAKSNDGNATTATTTTSSSAAATTRSSAEGGGSSQEATKDNDEYNDLLEDKDEEGDFAPSYPPKHYSNKPPTTSSKIPKILSSLNKANLTRQVLHEPLWRLNAVIESGIIVGSSGSGTGDWMSRTTKKQKLTHQDYVSQTGNEEGREQGKGGNMYGFTDAFLDVDVEKRLVECKDYEDIIVNVGSVREELANEVKENGEIERTMYFRNMHKRVKEWREAVEKRVEEANDAIELEGGERVELEGRKITEWKDIVTIPK